MNISIAASTRGAIVTDSSVVSPWLGGEMFSLSAGFMFHKFCGGQNMKIAGTMYGSMFRMKQETRPLKSVRSLFNNLQQGDFSCDFHHCNMMQLLYFLYFYTRIPQ